MKYLVYGCLSGSFGGRDGGTTQWEIVDANSENDAVHYAYELALGVYQDYEGMYGLPTEEECEESGDDYSDAIESWIEYDVEMKVDDAFNLDEWLDSEGLA